MMRVALVAVLALFAWTAPAVADILPERAPDIASYDIRVSLDADAKRLTGRQRLTWRNPSTDRVSELWFHLYLNAFKNTQSTFWRESGGELRGFSGEDGAWGWIDVTRMTLSNGHDLTAALRFESPDDGNGHDRTVARVPLPAPVEPGSTLTLDIEFTAQLPRVFARTGFVRDYFLVGQWFPKLGVYEPAGTRGRTAGGWNCHQFHARSEFYADFGRYRVEMTVPSGFVLGATGVRTATRDNGDGTTTYVHEQADVHDFAWAADPRFVEIRRRFVASREVSPREARAIADLLGRPLEEVLLTDVDIVLLMQPERLPQAERYLQSAMLALKWFGLWYGRYPHRTLTIVDPAPGAAGSAGMEYPTFITAGSHALLGRWPFDQVRIPEEVTVHEIGHQFWQGMVANNEFEEPWLDEGITTYSSGKVMERAFGREASMASFAGLRLGAVEALRLENHADRVFDSIRKPSWLYDADAYGYNAYTKPTLVLRTLEAQVGEQTLARIMRLYHERWRFRHPTTDDFYDVVTEVAGAAVRPLLVSMIETGALLDYEVSAASSDRQRGVAGYIDSPGGRRLQAFGEQSGGPVRYETSVTLRRRGDLAMPVTVAWKFEGRAPERFTWDGSSRWKRIDVIRPERLEWVEVDPDRRLVLDVDWLNNARRLEPDLRAAGWLTSRWWLLAQAFISWVSL